MKNNWLHKAALSTAILPAAQIASYAQNLTVKNFTSPQEVVTKAQAQIASIVGGVINIAVILVGVTGVIMIVWALLQRTNGRSEGNQQLLGAGVGVLLAALMIFIIKALIFG